jgi:hypothetical protein
MSALGRGEIFKREVNVDFHSVPSGEINRARKAERARSITFRLRDKIIMVGTKNVVFAK